jgi:hypothetical protein
MLNMHKISELVNGLFNKNNKEAYRCLQELEVASERDNSVYRFFDVFVDMLDNDNSYIRTRGLLLISANSKWDRDCKIDEIIDKYLKHVLDDKPVTSRQCIRALLRIAEFKPALIEVICATLKKANPEKYASNMRSLIYQDIYAALEKINNLL